MTKLTLHHIIRSNLPWREESRTECGLNTETNDILVWTRDEAREQARAMGSRQRFSLHVCMTCWQTCERHLTWEMSPSAVVGRDANGWGQTEARERMDLELRAIAELISRHREEFDELVGGIASAPRLDEARAKRRVARAHPR